MQEEAIAESVRILKEHIQSNSGGLPVGQARGKIILPCGTGKTRISLRIIEQLTLPGELSVVLCPSIALVAQIRREYLQQRERDLRVLAVCSDETAGHDRAKEDAAKRQTDPTLDNSNVSANQVKGAVTTDAEEISDWIRKGIGNAQINIIIGTYQSSHRVATALIESGTTATVIVADEAHRTAGLRRIRNLEERIRDFTVCHDNDRFPAKYRVYQTATPRVYDTSRSSRPNNPDWVVRNMDDESVFGIELYRKSYLEAVRNGWLADYRIIALGVNDHSAYNTANQLATADGVLMTSDFLKGLTLALILGGATKDESRDKNVVIKSCISFMNTIAKSKAMANHLQSKIVKDWVQGWLDNNRNKQKCTRYTMEHLDASSNVASRENAKAQLGNATQENPHAIINVGIFGEGTDTPSLSAVAFLEARKSPIDVVQAVGRVMRTAPDKEIGYIICPIKIPPHVDAEQWLMHSQKEDGWMELGQILLALRAHDSRIEDDLSSLLQLYIPEEPETETTVVAIANKTSGKIQYFLHTGASGEVQIAINNFMEGHKRAKVLFTPLNELSRTAARQRAYVSVGSTETPASHERETGSLSPSNIASFDILDPVKIVTAKRHEDGEIELRVDSTVRDRPRRGEMLGRLNIQKTKKKAKAMINKGSGTRLRSGGKRRSRRTSQAVIDDNVSQLFALTGLEDQFQAIAANLLAKSGLSRNRIMRDLNILESSVSEAARHLRDDELAKPLDQHFQLDNLKDRSGADGCTIAALLLMNAAMLHQRIATGQWLSGICDLGVVKNDTNVVQCVSEIWERILRHDFRPILEPAVDVIWTVRKTHKLAGLQRALHHITAEAERIAEAYADMGADHAGPLFNRVMGNQASDGAYFTRPVAASITARLALDACGKKDWTDKTVWNEHKTVDPACGSGTLLAAMLTEMKRRSLEQGASKKQVSKLHKLAVENTIHGLDINHVSLQLAASQLTAGNEYVSYRRMGLHRMQYGPMADGPSAFNRDGVAVGTLELLGQKSVVRRPDELSLKDNGVGSQTIWDQEDHAELENAVDAVKDAHIVIMNPPFTNRSKMGEKFLKEKQKALRSRADKMEQILVHADPALKDFADKNSIAPLFVALADHCLKQNDGVIAMIEPTIALSGASGLRERQVLAQRYYIDTILTSRDPDNVNLSLQTSINESIVVMRRHCDGPKPPTRFIHLDKMPADDSEVQDFHECLVRCTQGSIDHGWGEVSHWPAERIADGDWTAAVWRSPHLAEGAWRFANHNDLRSIRTVGLSAQATGRLLRGSFEPAEVGLPGNFPILKSKGADSQTRIRSVPDDHWGPKKRNKVHRILDKAGYLLITAGQDNSTGRLTATASDEKFVGNGWMPVTGLSPSEAKATAVFINSTPGRLQLMRTPGRKLTFPTYSTSEADKLRIPDIKDDRIRQTLADCWEFTKDMEVPQFRDGECEVRRLWDDAVAAAMGWDSDELERLRRLLHQEPHVRGLGYGQYADEPDDEETDLR